jgi:hypothetical protein
MAQIKFDLCAARNWDVDVFAKVARDATEKSSVYFLHDNRRAENRFAGR